MLRQSGAEVSESETQLADDINLMSDLAYECPDMELRAYEWFLNRHPDWYPQMNEDGLITGFHRGGKYFVA